jgi:hypothetical protein
MAVTLAPNDRTQLREFLVQRFTLEELKTLTFDLGIDYNNLPHATTIELSRELIGYCEHRGRLRELVEEVLHQRPNDDLRRLSARLFDGIRSEPDRESFLSKRPDSDFKFDVFLAHNSEDKPQIEAIAKELKRRELKPWLDKEQIPPGRWFQDVIQEAIRVVKSVAIFIGPHGLGKWQALELRSFVSQCVETGLPVIPVLLPSVDELPKELLFLKELMWVRFTNIDDAQALDQLEWGITGKRP